MPPILCRKDRHSSQEEMLQGGFYLQVDRFAMEKWRLNFRHNALSYEERGGMAII